MNVGVLPLLVGAFTDHLHLEIRQSAIVATMEYVAPGVGALVAGWRVTRWRWQKAVLVLSVAALVLTLAAATVESLLVLLLVRALNGFALGSLYAIGVFAIGRSQQPDRFYGVFYTGQLIAYAATAYAIPFSTHRLGLLGPLLCTASWLAIPVIAFRWMPHAPLHSAGEPGGLPTAISTVPRRALISALGFLFFMLSVQAVWAFVERLGEHQGVSSETISSAIALSGLAGAAGSVAAGLIGTRIGRLIPSAVAVLNILIGYALLADSPQGTFSAGVCLYSLGWLLGTPYFMGQTAAADTTGRVTALMPIIQLGAGGLAPITAAMIAQHSGYTAVLQTAGSAALVAFLLMMSGAAWRLPRRCRAWD
jgi:MFS transporter, DHA1 family, inner membrane transport protein